jgi:hypothetical protein
MRETQLRTLGLLCALSLVPPERAQAQEPSLPAWRVVAGGATLDFSGDRKWGFGPTLSIRRMLSHRVALDLGAAVLLANSGPTKFETAVLATFGPSFVWRGQRRDFDVSMGFIAGTLWEERSGGQASTVGIFGALGGTYWFGALGVSGRAGYHLWYGDPGAELNIGMAVRF